MSHITVIRPRQTRTGKLQAIQKLPDALTRRRPQFPEPWIRVKVKGNTFPTHAMKAYRRSQVQLHSVSTSALNGMSVQLRASAALTPSVRTPLTQWTGYAAWRNTKKPDTSGKHHVGLDPFLSDPHRFSFLKSPMRISPIQFYNLYIFSS